MPQTEHRREYMRRYMAKRRAHSQRGERESEREGVNNSISVNTSVNTPLEKRNVNTPPFPLNPRTMSKRRLVDYLAYVGERGFYLTHTARGYELAGVGSGELVSFDAVAILETEVREMRRELGVERQRTTQLEGDLARLEAMLDTTIAEIPHEEAEYD